VCGIVGVVSINSNKRIERDLVIRMRDKIAHRGPDGAGIWISENRDCVLGHRRLSIIDLSEKASQPMSNHNESVIVVYNGEIYNHQEIRCELEKKNKYQWKTAHSDTETLLHAYEEWGLECFKRFYGMWAVGIYDRRDKNRPKVHLIRDRIGIKPLYVTRTNNGEWLFASEIKAITVHPDIHPEMDLNALWHYLTFIVAPAPLTMFKGIFKIPAGHMVSIDHEGNAEASKYWDCLPDSNHLLSFETEEDAEQELIKILKQSIHRRMVSDVPFGVLLSGGVDSSMNVALMSELMDRPVTTFSIGYEGHDDYNEFEYARDVSRRYKTDHHETLISRKEAQEFLPLLVQLQDEPIADNVCIPLYFLAKLVKESGTTVVQVGEGADENFLGYWWCEHYRNKEISVYNPAVEANKISLWRKLFNKKPMQKLRSIGEDLEIEKRAIKGQELFWGGAVCWWGKMREQLTPDPERFHQKIECPIKGLLPESHTMLNSHDVVSYYLNGTGRKSQRLNVLQKIPYMEHKLRLPEHLLMRVDKLTMAHSIEARVPFLDHDLVEFAMRLSPDLKLKNGVGKHLLKKAADPYLDKKIINRKKQGFGAPMEEWFKQGDFGARCKAAFERSRLCKDGFLDSTYVLELLNHQMNTGGGYSFHLWTIMNAVLWHEYWIEGRKDCF
jgi:asparagine synthase (glutamine-hydrolysing)